MGYPLVRVVWRDAHADRSGTWIQPADMDSDPYTVASVGWLVAPKPDHLSIAQSVSDDGALDHVLHIPTGWTLTVTTLIAQLEGL